MARMKLKKLEEFLQGVEDFEDPKVQLEQYATPPHITSQIMYNIQSQFDDIEGKFVADLGCGCGMLSVGAFLLGAPLTIGFELDIDAIDIFRGNVVDMELPGIDCVRADVLTLCSNEKWKNLFDTVVMNPPFGTKNNMGVDMRFLECGVHLATGAVYSLHKSSTRDYVRKKSSEWGVKPSVVAELRYNIDACYKFHKCKTVDIEVDLWRFDVTEKNL